ncbi:MAG: nucleotidyl transferase AbiEii/AbiGii toxin family protein [Nitrospirota bacterium]
MLDLSGRIDNHYVEALHVLKGVTDDLGIPFFIVGATARDLIFEHCYNIRAPRTTLDIDLGVEVADWDQFTRLTQAMIGSGRLTAGGEPQRFLFGPVRIDILPFGPVADAQGRIYWPPEHEVLMSMLGYREAYDYSETVRLSTAPELDVRVSTLPGLALMKIISWNDNYSVRKKDAEDLLFIMHNYGEAGNEERLYDREQTLMEEERFDIRLAGIRLLGRDIARICDQNTAEVIKSIFLKETMEEGEYRLVRHMIAGTQEFDSKFEDVLQLIEKLKQGFSEGTES